MTDELNKKCLRCENACKQNKNTKLITCPNFKEKEVKQ